jgi:hypothetical protein
MLAPALVPPTGMPSALRSRISLAAAVPPRMVDRRSWLPPVKNTPVHWRRISRKSSRPPSARLSKSSVSTRPASSRSNNPS